jgi:hypothetical protein
MPRGNGATALNPTFPENFDNLLVGENAIRGMSKASICASEDLSRHAAMVEQSMTMLNFLVKRHVHTNQDELTIQFLGIRLFNSGSSAMKLLMSGYYQSTVMVMRDILETTFLLDYFHSNRSEIAVWRKCDERKRNNMSALGRCVRPSTSATGSPKANARRPTGCCASSGRIRRTRDSKC